VRSHWFYYGFFAFFGLCWGACSSFLWWGPEPKAQQCLPQKEASLTTSALWSTTFAKSDGSAFGCLQVSWGDSDDEGRGVLVKVTSGGKIFGKNKQRDTYDVTPELSLPSSSQQGQQRRFRVFVLGAEYQNLSDAKKSYCESVMAKPSYKCFDDSERACWFWLSFRPKSETSSLSALEVAKGDQSACKLYSRASEKVIEPAFPEVYEPVLEKSPEEPNNPPEEMPKEPEQEQPVEADSGNQEVVVSEGQCAPGATRACYTANAATRGRGDCKEGTQRCSADKIWGACENQITPVVELCDLRDNDCDGQVDEKLTCPAPCKAPCVRTYMGPSARTRNGKALSGWLLYPQAVVEDNQGNLYISENGNHSIRKLDKQGNLTTFAGGVSGYRNGKVGQALFNFPRGMAFDKAGNLYVADFGNNRIRKIDPQGNVTTFAGNGARARRDGKGIAASFGGPFGLVIDSKGNLFVSDTSIPAIRRIDSQGNVVTYAGTGARGFRDGPAASAAFSSPNNLIVDGTGNIFVADGNNFRVRMIDTQRQVSTFAGSSTRGSRDGPAQVAQFALPYGITVDSAGNVLVSDMLNHRIRRIDPLRNVKNIAGLARGFQDGLATTARFFNPGYVSMRSNQTAVIVDSGNHCLRTLTLTGAGTVRRLVGSLVASFSDGLGDNARFNRPSGIAFDKSGNLYIADVNNHRIRKIDPFRRANTYAGNGLRGFNDAQGKSAQFASPEGLAVGQSGQIFVADSGNHRIRKIDTATQTTTHAGASASGYVNATGSAARFFSPRAIVMDAAGNAYVVDTNNHRIRKVSRKGVVTLVAGSSKGIRDGVGAAAQFNTPNGIALGKDGDLYIADTMNQRIRKIEVATGKVTTFAGNGQVGMLNGAKEKSTFNFPHSLAFDRDGNLYISDSGNNIIRKIDKNGMVSTIAGTGKAGSHEDDALKAELNRPSGLAFDPSGNLYVADLNNFRILQILLR